MNKLGVHALVWEKGWSHEECARAIAQTAEVGYDLIEIPALDPSLHRHRLHAQAAREGGYRRNVLAGPGRRHRHFQQRSRQGKARPGPLEQAVAVIRDIGATHMCGILESAFQKYAVPTTAEGVKRACEVLAAGGREGRRQQHHASDWRW